jgi:spore coat polysaccharide biosynthesis protein SpsF
MMLPILVTARMSSQRLPGKSLLALAGKPVLQWVVDHLNQVVTAGPVIVATSSDTEDDAIASWCERQGVRSHRGPLEDVARRLMQAARALGSDAFVRISGDSPLIDPAVVTHAVELFKLGGADLVTNVQRRTFPKGCSVEVIRTEILDSHLATCGREGDHEHVTTAFYRNPDIVRITNFSSGAAFGTIQLAVDTREDLLRLEPIMRQLAAAERHPGWRRIVDLYRAAASLPSNASSNV